MAFCKVITVTGYLLLVSYGIGLAQKQTIPCKRLVNYFKLGTYGKYKSVINNRAFSKGKGNPGHTGYVEADHIPPLDSLKMAKAKEPEFGKLKKMKPALYDMVMSLENDKRGMNLFAVQVATHHHRAALSTGKNKDSEAVRAVLAKNIALGKVVKMLKQAMMIAHPFVSQSMRGIPRSFPGEKCSLSDDETKKIYQKGFLGLIKSMFERGIIRGKEMLELKDYVLNRGYFDIQSIEYKEILDAVKMNPPVG